MIVTKIEELSGRVMDPGILRVPGWEQFPWLRAGFSTRAGGLSAAYGELELNLGWTPEDDPGAIAANRAAFVRASGEGKDLTLVTVRQVHSAVVRDLEAEVQPWMTEDGKARLEGDGLISRESGLLLAVLTADCVPVLVADTRLRAVGAFHAGWRGTLARIVQHGVELMGERFGSRPEDLVAAIGPCIGSCCFEVGPEVEGAFGREFADARSLFGPSNGDKLRMDLVEANRRQLAEAGVAEEAIWAARECTVCSRCKDGGRKYFTYRGEAGVTGRMLSGIGIVA